MSKIGNVYFAYLLNGDEPFSAATHARNDLEILSASFVHMRGDAASIRVDARYPAGGIPLNSWATLSVEVDGQPHEIARGRMVSFPFALEGQIVSVELTCAHEYASLATDDLLASYADLAPEELAHMDDPRRALPFLLADPYHDPRSLQTELDPITGSGEPAATFYGEGAAANDSNILSISVDVSQKQIRSANLEVSSAFTEVLSVPIDIADAIASNERETLTAGYLRDALSALSMSGSIEILSGAVAFENSGYRDIYTKKREVDPFTCIVKKAEFVRASIDRIDLLEIKAIAQAKQSRTDIISIPLELMTASNYGTDGDTFSESLSGMEKYARALLQTTYITQPRTGLFGFNRTAQAIRMGVRSSTLSQGGALNSDPRVADILRAAVRAQVRKIVEAAMCIELRLEVDLGDAYFLTLRDKIRINDSRLPGGFAVGKLVAIEFNIANSATADLVIACPTSNGMAAPEIDADHAFDGDVRIEYDFALTHVDGRIDTDYTAAVRSGNAGNLVVADFIDMKVEQDAALEGNGPLDTDTQMSDPAADLPKSGFFIEPISFEQESENIERRMSAVGVKIYIPGGIAV